MANLSLSGPPRPARPARHAEVLRSEWLSPAMVRIIIGGDGLREIPELALSDHYIKLLFPAPGAEYGYPIDPAVIREQEPRELWPLVRTYTVRYFERERGELAIDFVVHGSEGIAGPWAASAKPGDPISFLGPGGGYGPDAAAKTHLLIGDESALPAIARTLELLPESSSAVVYAEIGDESQKIELPEGENITVNWVIRASAEYGEALCDVVIAEPLPAGPLSIFAHGNATIVKRLRQFFFVDHQLERKGASISGYWRTNFTEDKWQASKGEFVAKLDADEAAAAASRVK